MTEGNRIAGISLGLKACNFNFRRGGFVAPLLNPTKAGLERNDAVPFGHHILRNYVGSRIQPFVPGRVQTLNSLAYLFFSCSLPTRQPIFHRQEHLLVRVRQILAACRERPCNCHIDMQYMHPAHCSPRSPMTTTESMVERRGRKPAPLRMLLPAQMFPCN